MTNDHDLKTHGRTFKGTVTSDKMTKTVTVEFERRHFVPKYERYERRSTTLKAHNPEDMGAEEGDEVIVQETRPISKTKSFIVTDITSSDES